MSDNAEDLTLNQLKRRKKELQAEVREAIAKFNEDTGEVIESINVEYCPEKVLIKASIKGL